MRILPPVPRARAGCEPVGRVGPDPAVDPSKVACAGSAGVHTCAHAHARTHTYTHRDRHSTFLMSPMAGSRTRGRKKENRGRGERVKMTPGLKELAGAAHAAGKDLSHDE